MSLIELMVVVAIIAVVGTSLMSGYGRFTGNNKVNAATQRLTAALHLARNLAIANNRVYHVWFDNNDNNVNSVEVVDDGAGVTHVETTANPNYHKPLDKQAICVSYFKTMSRAMEVTERQPEHTTVKWNLSNSKDVSMDNFPVVVDKLEDHTYVGVQYVENVASPDDLVLYFKPDGTASKPMTFFVTDNPALADNLLLNSSEYQRIQSNRINAVSQKRDFSETNSKKLDGTVKLIQVYGGGMIREIKRPEAGMGTQP